MVLTESLTNGHVSSSVDSAQVNSPAPQTCGGARQDTGDIPIQYIYSLGKVEWRISDPAITHELMQALGAPDERGGYELARLLLPENRYLARRMTWVLVIQGQDAFYLKAQDSSEFALLLQAAASEYSLVVGTGSDAANIQNLPTIWFNQIYHFNLEGLFQNLAVQLGAYEGLEQSPQTLDIYRDLFERILYTADNAGHQPAFRAMNYLAVRYPIVYAETAKLIQTRHLKLTGIEVHRSHLNFGRQVENVIFVFKDGQTHIQELYSVSVDVTGEFPFLVKPFSRYNKLKSCGCGG
jgi:hypothetical protein